MELTRKQAKQISKEEKGYSNSNFRTAYSNAKYALENAGLRGKEKRQAARRIVAGIGEVPETKPIILKDTSTPTLTLPEISFTATEISDFPERKVEPVKPVSFSQAFGDARKAGLDIFEWNGKKYTTELKKPDSKTTTEKRTISEPTQVSTVPTETIVPEKIYTIGGFPVDEETYRKTMQAVDGAFDIGDDVYAAYDLANDDEAARAKFREDGAETVKKGLGTIATIYALPIAGSGVIKGAKAVKNGYKAGLEAARAANWAEREAAGARLVNTSARQLRTTAARQVRDAAGRFTSEMIPQAAGQFGPTFTSKAMSTIYAGFKQGGILKRR